MCVITGSGSKEKYDDVGAISEQHGGVFGFGVSYAFTIFAAQKARPEPEEAELVAV